MRVNIFIWELNEKIQQTPTKPNTENWEKGKKREKRINKSIDENEDAKNHMRKHLLDFEWWLWVVYLCVLMCVGVDASVGIKL